MVSFNKISASFGSILLISATIVSAEEAPQNLDNPEGAIYKAHLDSGDIKGIIEIYTARNSSAKVHLDITGLPEKGGPFFYHLHQNKVPESGDCEATGTHFNPYEASFEECDSNQDDSYCQVGDLSGKHGWINTTCFQTTYYDPYLSLNKENKAFIGDLSVVVHYSDMTKMLCANLYESKRKFWKKEYTDDFTDVHQQEKNDSYSNSTSGYGGQYANYTNSTNGSSVEGITSTYCGSATKQTISTLLGALIGLLISFF
ncbi:hypothetical protein FOA43_000412 [Brettanomyces nanus]|uniref:superoxide dismutase n=1 Tax=Eeniella nana TaxID=13502 RepID=A0A875RT30_EENNA|nr:uncharacterized protein FOA43_000412 [Brettanomyces nanus]QPG73107.1 hypothetical protein FOA43_000412 [Brettanomyces nanus]